ncbi:group I truncated hemoglobin [Cognatazoarcus halotolerans]|uniref:group I truncated hemoglobin n=1 Tax=Cognatazoarcus halotolerans TaxID=2686016 RepID=UPI0013573666|nr:group 1 truncated hemoglobin [Cognatazoarcus halotolerans]
MTTTLLERLGGSPALELAVDRFYHKVLADERIRHFFAGTDMSRQRAHLKAFLTHAFGGSGSYDGKGLRQAHQGLVARLGLSDSHFDAVVEHLAGTLTELGVTDERLEEVARIAESIRNDVLCR